MRQNDRIACLADALARFEKAQAQRIGYHAHRRKAHRGRADHRAELDAERHPQRTRCDRNADAVIEERPEQVLTDVAYGLPRQTDRVHCVHEVALHQHNIRRRDRDIRARADGNADIGPRERRCIVDAVADHCDPAACGLLLTHDALLVLRQDLCDDLANAKLRGDGLRGLFIVAGQQRDLDAHALERLDRRAARRFEHICYRERADDLTVRRKE